ncbi:hypothetical protein ABPG72_022086 [Tetrahymena utriculariae]
MGNIMCCEQSNLKQNQKQDKPSRVQVQNQIQAEIYYTNPATKDEDFTFNDKIKLQSYMNKYDVNYVPNFTENTEGSWYQVAQRLIIEINQINTDPDWNVANSKLGLEVIYSQKDEKIIFGSKQVPTKFVNQALLNIGIANNYQQQESNSNVPTEKYQSFRNSIQNSFSNNGPLSNPDFKRSKKPPSPTQSAQVGEHRKSFSNQMCVNIVKLEFEVNCSAEKLLKGLQNLKRYTNKIQKQTTIESSQNKEFSISHIIFAKQMQKVQRDLVLASFYTDIGPNLNNCYTSVNHHKVPEIDDIVRAQIIKAGHTFFEHYETAEEKLTSSFYKNQNKSNNSQSRKESQLNEESTFQNTAQNNQTAFGSMNLNIGQVKTKVRFYGEFVCKSTFDESVVKMVFLTEFKEYIAMFKNIAQQESVCSSEYEAESVDHTIEHNVDIIN